jgi:coenzyme F420-0:L-glutamate ligase/coenzyme F420-1:gamma-L-glutamate ligase
VDASNVPGDESLCLLPRDPDASARALRNSLVAATGADIAVVITDSFGRPWRNGIVNIAIGVAGIAPLVDYRGQPDDYGRVMSVSVIAVADEIASAAELVMGKVSRCPLVLVRGYSYQRGNSTAREIVMDRAMDLFP